MGRDRDHPHLPAVVVIGGRSAPSVCVAYDEARLIGALTGTGRSWITSPSCLVINRAGAACDDLTRALFQKMLERHEAGHARARLPRAGHHDG